MFGVKRGVRENTFARCVVTSSPAMLTELFVASIGQVPKGGCFTTMVPTADVERTSVELCASLPDSGTSVVVDGSAKVLRALGLSSTTNELVQFLKCYYEAEDDGVQVTTVAMLVLGLASVVDNWFAGSGKQMTVHTEDVAADEFNRESSRLILICRDLHSDILGYLTESKSERWCFFVLFSFF